MIVLSSRIGLTLVFSFSFFIVFFTFSYLLFDFRLDLRFAFNFYLEVTTMETTKGHVLMIPTEYSTLLYPSLAKGPNKISALAYNRSF